MTLKEFSDQVLAVQHAILDEMQAHPLTELPRAPKDWNELRSIVRNVAEELILCSDVKEAISRLQRDPGTLPAIDWLTNTAVSLDDSLLAIKLAYAATAHEPTILPFHAYSSYLIELCNHLELVKRDDKI